MKLTKLIINLLNVNYSSNLLEIFEISLKLKKNEANIPYLNKSNIILFAL